MTVLSFSGEVSWPAVPSPRDPVPPDSARPFTDVRSSPPDVTALAVQLVLPGITTPEHHDEASSDKASLGGRALRRRAAVARARQRRNEQLARFGCCHLGVGPGPDAA